VELLNLLATTYIRAGRLTDARQVARDAIAADPTDNDALYHQGLIESQLIEGDLDLAMRDATQLKAQNPSSPKAYGLLADVYYRRRQSDDAVRTLEDGLKADPQDRNCRLRLLAAYSAATPPSWPDYDRLVHEAENDPQLRPDAVWLVRDAYGLAARKQFDAAIQKVDEAIAGAPDQPELVSDKLSILMTAGNYPAVIQTADALEAKGIKPWWMYLARGAAKAQSDKPSGLIDLDAALAAATDFAASARVMNAISVNIGVEQALQRAQSRPDDPDWRLMAADLQVKKGDFPAAIAQAAPLRGNNTISQVSRIHALTLLAESYTIIHQPQNAKDAYLEALTIAPNDPEMLNNLANVVADDLHDPQQALTYSQRAYDLSRRSGVYLQSISDTHGWVLTLCGGSNAAAGLDILQKLVLEHQDFTFARYHLGEAYLRSAMPADAVKQLEIAQTQVQQAEAQHTQVSAELKAAIAGSLAKARQILDGKADAGGR
jgi:tetratricopeptide (TPR) repeat protein